MNTDSLYIQVQGIGRITLDYAIDQFLRHCRLKNLSKTTQTYYEEDLRYFQRITEVTYASLRLNIIKSNTAVYVFDIILMK